VDNLEIARTFDELADLLELAGHSANKLSAYRDFAESAREHDEPLEAVAARRALREIEGVGVAIARDVAELLERGTFAALERARAAVPASLVELARLPGLGPRTVRAMWQRAGVTTVAELYRAAEEGRLAKVPGVGRRMQARALALAAEALSGGGSTLLGVALEGVALIAPRLAAAGAREVLAAGAVRRGAALVDGALVLARALEPARALEAVAGADVPGLELLAPEGADLALVTPGGARLRVRPVPEARWIEEVVRATGSDAHVRLLEERAGGEEGLGQVCARAAREEDVYRALGLRYVPPELRDLASCEVPHDLVDRLHGVFHVHTDWSDGRATLAEMARAAEEAGLSFVGISDHSQAASYANGLDPVRLMAQMDDVKKARERFSRLAILHGVEVDILPDGSLDLPDEVLARLDFVIASVHERFDLSPEEMTARIVRAVRHPLVTILGHPTGRLLRARRGYTFDMREVARAAAANDTYLEINGNPHRLDLSDVLARQAAAEGARFAINPDAHEPRAIADHELGLRVARRAGLAHGQVLNALPRAELERVLAVRRARALAV
jgi:DNA polymerase (family 10)